MDKLNGYVVYHMYLERGAKTRSKPMGVDRSTTPEVPLPPYLFIGLLLLLCALLDSSIPYL